MTAFKWDIPTKALPRRLRTELQVEGYAWFSCEVTSGPLDRVRNSTTGQVVLTEETLCDLLPPPLTAQEHDVMLILASLPTYSRARALELADLGPYDATNPHIMALKRKGLLENRVPILLSPRGYIWHANPHARRTM